MHLAYALQIYIAGTVSHLFCLILHIVHSAQIYIQIDVILTKANLASHCSDSTDSTTVAACC